MSANNSISLTSLDFDTLRAQLVQFLQGQTALQDYNFAGSNMSVLLDLLSYNSFQNAFYTNMLLNESFLDSAQLLSSVVSKAKELNYTPRSYRSSTATFTVSVPQSGITSGLTSFTIPANTIFTGQNANSTYNFITQESMTIYPSDGAFTANVTAYEGSLLTDTFVVNYNTTAQQFIMSSNTIDTDSLVVNVISNTGQSVVQYQQATSLYGLNSNSAVYFLEAASNSQYQVTFGDGVFGAYPLNGSIVQCTYRTTHGSDGNACLSFNIVTNLGPANGLGSAPSMNVTTISGSFGGANAESINSIRFNAPRAYQTQQRAVTTNDYRDIILSNFPDIKEVQVYGGETLIPPVFGTVFICPLTNSGAPITDVESAAIVSFLQPNGIVGITSQVVEPDFLYLLVNSNVTYDSTVTTYTPNDISNIVSGAIATFNTQYLTDFDTKFQLSRFESFINSADPSILTNENSITMMKILSPTLGSTASLNFSYGNPIQPGSFSSTSFISGASILQYSDYNPNNITFTFNQTQTGLVVKNSTNIVYLINMNNPAAASYTPAGTIDYETGTVSLNQINVNSFLDSEGIQFYATPVNQDITIKGNAVIEIDIENGVTINVEQG